ncbi:MAG: transglutaminase domain-containing protein [Bacteroidota bacterium]
MKTSLKILFIALCCILGPQAYGLKSVNLKLLNHAKNVPDSLTNSIEELTEYLIEASSNEFEKAEVICYWIAENIAYDVEAYKSGRSIKNYREAFARKRGVHRTYAALFHEMCKLAGIECFIVSGYAKGYNFDIDVVFTKANHAWNVVQIDGLYYFVDTAWGSGKVEMDGDRLDYLKVMSLSEMLTREDDFLDSHLPIDPRWQLRESILPMDDFIHPKDSSEAALFAGYYNYRDSIAHFTKLSEDERITLTFESADRFYRTNDNLTNLGHHLFNRARKRSLGKVRRPELEESSKLYRRAIAVYEKLKESDRKISIWIDRAYEGLQYNQYYLNRMRK